MDPISEPAVLNIKNKLGLTTNVKLFDSNTETAPFPIAACNALIPSTRYSFNILSQNILKTPYYSIMIENSTLLSKSSSW